MQYLVDTLFGIGLFINAALFIPQALKIHRDKAAKNVSLLTFLGFNCLQFITILHGYYHQDYILMIGYSLSFITCSFVTLQKLYYQ